MLDIGDDTVGWLQARYLPVPMTGPHLVSSGEIPPWEPHRHSVPGRGELIFCLVPFLNLAHWVYDGHYKHVWLYDWPNNLNDLKY